MRSLASGGCGGSVQVEEKGLVFVRAGDGAGGKKPDRLLDAGGQNQQGRVLDEPRRLLPGVTSLGSAIRRKRRWASGERRGVMPGCRMPWELLLSLPANLVLLLPPGFGQQHPRRARQRAGTRVSPPPPAPSHPLPPPPLQPSSLRPGRRSFAGKREVICAGWFSWVGGLPKFALFCAVRKWRSRAGFDLPTQSPKASGCC